MGPWYLGVVQRKRIISSHCTLGIKKRFLIPLTLVLVVLIHWRSRQDMQYPEDLSAVKRAEAAARLRKSLFKRHYPQLRTVGLRRHRQIKIGFVQLRALDPLEFADFARQVELPS